MANTYTLISSQTLASSAASVTFSSIPATYTDLVLRYSARSDVASNFPQPYISFNGVATGGTYSQTLLQGSASTALSLLDSNISAGVSPYNVNGSLTTTNTFGSTELYIPSYTVVQNKPMSFATVNESNSATVNQVQAVAALSRTTATITSITLSMTNFVTGSSFYLYGISKS